MENCKHNTHHNDCCVCWFKQSNGTVYDGDVPLFMHKMAALLAGVTWHDYCMSKALGSAKDAVEDYYPKFKDYYPDFFEIADDMDKDETKSTAQKVLEMRRNAVTW